jgi:hypothetical protein
MLRRITGLVLIVSVLMPIILGVGSIFLVRQIVADIEDVARVPLQRMNMNLNQAKDALVSARQAFDRAVNNVASVVQKAQQVRNSITSILTDIRIPRLNIPDPSISVPTVSVEWSSALGIRYPSNITIGSTSISIPVPDIPEFTVPVPGLPLVKNVVRDVVGVVDDLTSAVTSITGVKALTENINDAVQQAQVLADRVEGVRERWQTTITLIVTVIVLCLVITYVALTLQVLAKGWQMLTT